MQFVLAFNIIFAVTESLCWRLLTRGKAVRINWRYRLPVEKWNALCALLLTYWAVGGVWWFWQTKTANYRDYVEGASWGSVFFWSSSPLIILAAMRGRWLFASVLCAPFLYFCAHLDVRSFALLSLVPMFVVGFYQIVGDTTFRQAMARLPRYALLAGGVLVGVSIWISQFKTHDISFPDSTMPFGVAETVGMADVLHRQVGFDGLILYGWNYINPFMKLFSIQHAEIADTPNVIAGLLDGVPPNWPVYYHYPALIWADAYVSFAWWGLWMAALWAVVVCLWEWIMRRNELILALVMPFFCWHSYMLVRGAVAIASVPESYSIYFSFFAFVAVFWRGLFFKSTGGEPRPLPRRRQPPANLLT
jgi:hypothetical protein